MRSALIVEIGGGSIGLLGQRAAYLPESGTLLVADVHLGKAQTFRKLGVPVPGGTTTDNLRRLDAVIEQTRPRQIAFLGDLLHAPQARTDAVTAAVAKWRGRHAGLAMTLVRGNHDARAGDPPLAWALDVVDAPWLIGGWALSHEPQPVAGAYVLAGHVHPCAHVGSGLDRLRLPCFHFSACVGLLPAFGDFTGMHAVSPDADDIVVVVCDGELRRVSGRPSAGA